MKIELHVERVLILFFLLFRVFIFLFFNIDRFELSKESIFIYSMFFFIYFLLLTDLNCQAIRYISYWKLVCFRTDFVLHRVAVRALVGGGGGGPVAGGAFVRSNRNHKGKGEEQDLVGQRWLRETYWNEMKHIEMKRLNLKYWNILGDLVEQRWLKSVGSNHGWMEIWLW